MNIDQIFRELNIKGELVSVDLGTVVFNQGQPSDGLYVVKSGRLRVLKEDEDGQSNTTGYLYAGDHFGEGALLIGKGHRATVRAAEDSEVLHIEPEDFQRALKNDSELKAYFKDHVAHIAYRNFTRFLQGGSDQIPAEAIQHLFGNLKRQVNQLGETVIKRGDVGSGLYLIGGGELEAVGQEGEITILKSGDFFGDQALIDGIVEPFTISVRGSCVLFRLDKNDFYEVIGSIPALRSGFEAGRCVQEVEAEDNEPQVESTNGIPENVHQLDHAPEAGHLPRSLQFPFLKQHDQSDCGAACLGMICKYYKMPIGLNRLRDMSNVSRSGTSMAALAEAAETLGFLTRGVRTGYEKLMHTELPAILHWKGNHFVVLFKTAKDQVRIADPAVGFRKLSRKEFEAEWTGMALLIEYTDQVAENEPSRTTFRRFIPYVKPYIRSLCEIFLASLVMSLFGLASPLFTQTIVDQVLVHHDRDLLNLMLAGMIIIALFQMLVSALRTYLVTYMSTRLSMTLLSRFYQHLLSLPMRFFALRKTGDITTRFGENATIQALLTGTVVSLILDVIVLFVYLSLMIYYHLQLTLVVLAFIPLSIILTLVYTPILKSLSQRAFIARAEQSSVLIDSLRGIDTVKTLAIERSTRWRWEERYMKSIQIRFSGMKIGLLFGSAGGLMNLFSSTFILWYGATLVMDGELSVGQLMAFNSFAWLDQHDLTLFDVVVESKAQLYEHYLIEQIKEESIRAFFVQHTLDFEHMEVCWILVSDEGVAEELCLQVKEEGADFYTLARRYSQNEATRPAGGYLGRRRRRDLPQGIAPLIFAASEGDVVGPSKVEKGYALYYVQKRYPAVLDKTTREKIRKKLFESYLQREMKRVEIIFPFNIRKLNLE